MKRDMARCSSPMANRHVPVWAILAGFLVSCGAVPTAPERNREEPSEPKASAPRSEREAMGAVTRALVSAGRAPREASPAAAAAGAAEEPPAPEPSAPEPPAPAPPAAAADAPEPPAAADRAPAVPPPPSDPAATRERVEELFGKLADEWEALHRILGGRGGDELRGGALGTAARLIALSFLADGADLNRELLEDAVALAVDERSAPEYRLLAAAYLQKHGTRDEAARAVSGLCLAAGESVVPAVGRSAAPSGEAPPPEAGGFRLRKLSFAKKIDGPGRFDPADPGDAGPGKTLLVYGEFEDYRSLAETDPSTGAILFRRQFAASLQLIGPDGEELDRLEFLPKDRGIHTSPLAEDTINFWARYRIPATLRSGSYRIRIEAEDAIGGAKARGELHFEVGGEAGVGSAHEDHRGRG